MLPQDAPPIIGLIAASTPPTNRARIRLPHEHARAAAVKVRYPSKVPQRRYATTLDAQRRELCSDPLLARFAASRRRLANDRYRPTYHFVNPEGMLNDPNGLCYWQGRYHLFYQAYPPEDPRQHWGHAVSDDLIHWQDLPLALYPDIEHACFSGSTLVEDDRVIAMYHGTRAGNMVAVSHDPLLLNWEKIAGNPVIPMIDSDDDGWPYRVFDPCIWKESEGYYSLSGSLRRARGESDHRVTPHLFFSQDLRRWTYLGPFVEGDIFTMPGEDAAVPYFWPIGDRHILIFASHRRGSQYLLGDYDTVRHRFQARAHGRFNHGAMGPGGVHAPSATPDGSGALHLIHNMNQAMAPRGWNHLMSLASRLWLDDEGAVRIAPVAAVESLRHGHRHVGETLLPANQDVVLDGVAGSCLEIAAELHPRAARELCVEVLRAPDRQEHTAISFHRHGHVTVVRGDQVFPRDAIVIDGSRSSLRTDVSARPPEVAPLELRDDEPLRLRVFVDRSVVEVFVNERQWLAVRVYPERADSIGVALRAQGGDALLRSLDAWSMRSIWESAGLAA